MFKHKLLIFFSALFPLGVVAQTVPTATIYQDDSKNGITRRIENGYDYVDLGLSVMWATCNVGSTTPTGYGDYFAWGETSPKTYYDWDTYKYCKGTSNTITKYCIDGTRGTVDNKTTLELADDAARVNWGGNWRMPTKAEQDELRNNCTWSWTTQNGVKGYQAKSKNGNSIFLPAAGSRYLSELIKVGLDGYYWSSSLALSYSAYMIIIQSSPTVDRTTNERYGGKSVRPVLKTPSTYTLKVYVDGGTKYNTYHCSKGQQLSIVAKPKDCQRFVRWSDGNVSNPRTVTVNSNMTLTAEFASNCFTVVASSEHGSVTGSGTYNYGATATLKATNSDCYTFQKWSDGKTDNPRQVVVTQDSTFTAIFVGAGYQETVQCTVVNESPYGTVSFTGEVVKDSEIALKATAPECSQFVKWSDNNTDNPRSVEMTQDSTFTAIFEKIQFNLSVDVNDSEHSEVETKEVEE